MTITIPGPQPAQSASAATASFGYDAVEDRIVGVFAQGQAGAKVLLTRRLVRSLLASLAKMLDQASPLAGRAPAAMRAEVVEMEHRSAVAQLSSAPGFPPQAAAVVARLSPAMLVARIDLTLQENGHLLVLHDAAGRNVSVKMQWHDLHRLVGALHEQAAAAKWDLAAAPWLAPSAEPRRPAA